MSIESVMPSNHLILCRPLLLLPLIFPSFRVFSNESALLIRWSKYWSFKILVLPSISPSNEHAGLISFRSDQFDLAVQRTLKSLLQHHSSKTSVLSLSAFFRILFAKFRHTLKKVGKVTRPFRYDLNHIAYNNTVEVTNRFKGLDLIDRMAEELWMGVHDIVQEPVINNIPKGKKNAKQKNGFLRRPYKQLRKEEKLKAKE